MYQPVFALTVMTFALHIRSIFLVPCIYRTLPSLKVASDRGQPSFRHFIYPQLSTPTSPAPATSFLPTGPSTSPTTHTHAPLQTPPPQNDNQSPCNRTHRVQPPHPTLLRSRRRAPRRPAPTAPIESCRRVVFARLRARARGRAASSWCITWGRGVG